MAFETNFLLWKSQSKDKNFVNVSSLLNTIQDSQTCTRINWNEGKNL